MKIHPAYEMLRPGKKFPNVWCPGCGHGIVQGAIIRAVERLGINRDEVAMVSGIGCSSRMPVYVDFNSLHTAHGRALPFATGVKLHNPKLHVIVITGDGDALAIGGNHFIHAARRNMELTVILMNNNIYGMTGGQYSPTTPIGKKASTAPYGCAERDFDACALAVAAGAVFAARGTVYNAVELDKMIEKALTKKGFALVEALSPCPTLYGRLNKEGSAVKMLQTQKANTINLKAAEKLTPQELEGKVVTGVFHDGEAQPYTEVYQQIINKAQGR
ncbi:2-oxoacid:ferredoxin oxidoreductase subunit beta [candidate division TA06 bacterium]|nr:2-oxoacid:ferredoxin oxidoreductase subunit beta [candidate division TA06 bacterium]